MRAKLCGMALFCVGTLALAQDAPAPVVRYGIVISAEAYPQGTVKDALASAVKAIDKDRFEYLAAHLLDPKFIDGRVEDRAKQMEDVIDKELRLARDEQLRQGVPRRERLPSDAADFAAVVRQEASARAFKLVARDVREHLSEYPESVKEFRRYLRDGVVVDAGDVATVTLKDVKEVQINLRKVGVRWHLEDRQGPEPVEKK